MADNESGFGKREFRCRPPTARHRRLTPITPKEDEPAEPPRAPIHVLVPAAQPIDVSDDVREKIKLACNTANIQPYTVPCSSFLEADPRQRGRIVDELRRKNARWVKEVFDVLDKNVLDENFDPALERVTFFVAIGVAVTLCGTNSHTMLPDDIALLEMAGGNSATAVAYFRDGWRAADIGF